MAIDTAAKRNSALLDPGNMPWQPDGTISVGDRLVMLEFYSGIAAEAPLDVRVIYRPQTASGPAAYRPGAVGGPAAYRPMSATLPPFYRPNNPTTPSG